MNQNGKKRWPYDAATTIALIALIASGLQFLLSSPIFIELYFTPELIVRDSKTRSGDSLSVSFTVTNEGLVTAKNIHVGIMCHDSDKVLVLPELGAQISPNNSIYIITHDIYLPYLAPKEMFTIIVVLKRKSQITELGKMADGSGNWIKSGPYPSVGYIRSESGMGENRSRKLEVIIIKGKQLDTSSIKPGAAIWY